MNLRWVRAGEWCLKAWWETRAFTVCKISVRGVVHYELWDGKRFVDRFDDSVAARAHAKGLL